MALNTHRAASEGGMVIKAVSICRHIVGVRGLNKITHLKSTGLVESKDYIVSSHQ